MNVWLSLKTSNGTTAKQVILGTCIYFKLLIIWIWVTVTKLVTVSRTTYINQGLFCVYIFLSYYANELNVFPKVCRTTLILTRLSSGLFLYMFLLICQVDIASLPLAVDSQPDTQDVDRSEISTQIMLATASSALRGRHSFTHMLTQVRTNRYLLTYCLSQKRLSEWVQNVIIIIKIQDVYDIIFNIYNFSNEQKYCKISVLNAWTPFHRVITQEIERTQLNCVNMN